LSKGKEPLIKPEKKTNNQIKTNTLRIFLDEHHCKDKKFIFSTKLRHMSLSKKQVSMMRSILTLALVLLLIPNSNAMVCDQNSAKETLANFKWVAEDYPPYNYLGDDGQVTGMFTDVLLKVYQEMEIPLEVKNIKVIPWARLYNILSFQQDSAGYSMTSTPERKKRFALVELPIYARISILVKKSRQAEIAAKGLENITIAAVREDIGHHQLNVQNIPSKQMHTTTAEGMLKMLQHNRVEAIAYSEDVARYQSKKLGITGDELVRLHSLIDDALNSYMFHRNTDKCVTQLFSQTIDKLHKAGELNNIVEKYLK